ncbi:MAG: hypothetical protein SFU86_18190 [Pirellulaceae bacterium]|nr:hypothetical protein [Pirellulaceae bacterium]
MFGLAPSSRSRRRIWRLDPALFVFATLCTTVLGVANSLGYTRSEPDLAVGTAGSRELASTTTRLAGWPWPYLAVQGDALIPWTELHDSLGWASPLAAAADLLVGLATAIAAGAVLAWWWRGRTGWRQFGLRDLALAMALVAAVLAWVVLPSLATSRERRALCHLSIQIATFDEWERQPGGKSVLWQPGPLAWLRPLTGDLLPLGDRVVGLSAYSGDIPQLAAFPHLRALRLHGTTTDRELTKLARLPRLEMLDLTDVVPRQDQDGWLAGASAAGKYPLALPHLRRLYARDNLLQGSDLAGLASLEELDLSGSVVDRESAATLGTLTTLRILDLHDTALDDELLADIARLPNLELLDISGTDVTDAGLAHLAHLPRLMTIWVAQTAITDRGLAKLAGCPRLDSVRVTGSEVTRGGLVAFRRARPSCQVHP